MLEPDRFKYAIVVCTIGSIALLVIEGLKCVRVLFEMLP